MENIEVRFMNPTVAEALSCLRIHILHFVCRTLMNLILMRKSEDLTQNRLSKASISISV